MSPSTLVSLVLPAYKSSWFEEALRCAFAQDYDNIEIIVSDDCPNNDISDIVSRYQSLSPFPLTYIRNVPALGEAKNVMQCIREAKGEYIKFLYDDDTIEPQCVSSLVKTLQQFPSVRLATSRRSRIGVYGERLCDIGATVPIVAEDSILNGRDIVSYQLQEIVNFIGEPSTVLMYRQDLLDLMEQPDGLFALDGLVMHFLGDLTIYMKILQKGDVAYLVKPLSSLRVSRQQVSQLGRERDSRAEKTHTEFPKRLKLLDMGDETTTPLRHIRVASFTQPDQFVLRDISSEIQAGMKESQLADWLQQRQVPTAQQSLLDERNASVDAADLTVVIFGGHGAQDVEKTLASLMHKRYSGLTIHPVVVGMENVEHVRTFPASVGLHHALEELATERPGGWFIAFQAGGEFYDSGLTSLASTLIEAESLSAIYGDEIFTIDQKVIGGKFKSDFNLDLFLSQPQMLARSWFLRGETITQFGIDASMGAAFEFDLLIKLIESQGFAPLGHLAEPLFLGMNPAAAPDQEQRILQRHLHNRGYTDAQIEVDIFGHYHIQYGHADVPLVSIIIAAGDRVAPLVTCVTSVIEKTQWPQYEMIVIADQTAPSEVTTWLNGLAEIDPARIKVCYAEGITSHARAYNQASTVAQGRYVAFVHPDLVITQPGWLTALLNHGQRPEVGVVGGKQLYGDGTVRHAGYLLGVNGVAGEAFYGTDDSFKSYMGRLHADQNYSAVSGDFMLVDKQAFDAAGGIDDALDSFWDIDLCLRIREQGWFTVWTPSATVLRTIGRKEALSEREKTTLREQKEREEDEMFRRWMPLLCNDPAYNINLSLSSEQFMVNPDSKLSWRPLSWNPLPVVMPHMGDYAGCGYYRIIKPFESMVEHQRVDGKLSPGLASMPALARYKPDSIIIQRQFTPEFQQWMRVVKKRTGIFSVFELDDYLPNIPVKNQHKQEFDSDTLKNLRKTLSYMDRFVVSTQPLADAFSPYHPNIVVMQNRVSADWWSGLTSLRQQGRKPRVGWAGGSSHRGDLEMIADVVKAFASEVDWIFLGMCPDKLLPYVHEFHHGVDIEVYPRKLASLNLDLAIAPVEDNLFNACKSNLRLLEYGACAIPVICSDVECYRSINEVTRVRNRYKDWADALRFHLDNPAQSERMGKALQTTIFRDWMHNADSAALWAKAWLPD
ncbi:glycosyltransferase [Enterobacter cancerogenus]|uniref:glycosyltransferase n=1 Tax=Enterobacter cancerogenus TaxID=69218 RepID=UPI00384E85CA